MCDNVSAFFTSLAYRKSKMKRILFSVFLTLLAFLCIGAQTPFTIDELLKVDRVGDPQVSPDGRWVAYSVQQLPGWSPNKFVKNFDTPTPVSCIELYT